MRITLRKKDSVTSAVLFLFNLIGDYKETRTMKLKDLLELMGYFGKSEATVRTGLSRMVKSNLLVNGRDGSETIYSLTDEGRYNIDLWNHSFERFYKRQAQRAQGWNRHWSFLTIIDFNKSDYANQFIVDELEACGLRDIGSNLWVTPYAVDDEIINLLKDNRLGFLKFSGSLDSNIDLPAYLAKALDLEATREKYETFLEKISLQNLELSQADISRLFLLLFESGWDFSDAIGQDPVLPKEFLPVWGGDAAALAMKNLRSDVIPRLTAYLKEKNI